MSLRAVRRRTPKTTGSISPGTAIAAILALDRRSREGRQLAAIAAMLEEHLGEPNAAQRLLIMLAAAEGVKVAKLTPTMLAETGPDQPASEAWSKAATGLKRSLQLLGIDRVQADAPDLNRYLELKAGGEE